MIEHAAGDLLQADVEALVNSVNTVGVMGKGVALQFRQAYPGNYEAYLAACKHNAVRPGHIHVYKTGLLTNPKYILNFPTKRHWKGKSRMADIEAGLADLAATIRGLGIRSIAIPPLGCGNGGLRWSEVLPRIEETMAALHNVHVLVYAPEGAPAAEKMRVATKTPRITPTRAALLGLLRTYARPGYGVTMLEVQKLAYFLQVAGEPMRLSFVRGTYGPYAETLHHMLQRIEGHFIRGYGDRSRDVSIALVAEAEDLVDDLLARHTRTRERLDRVAGLIEGFETPYGLELLATVHQVACEDRRAQKDYDAATEAVYAWSERKRAKFSRNHVRVAWMRLNERAWL